MHFVKAAFAASLIFLVATGSQGQKLSLKSPQIPQGFVFQTWNEQLNNKFPQVLQYRAAWTKLGYELQITPNKNIRLDVARLHEEHDDENFLGVFDSLETVNMQFDFWRFTKLYLDGGIYADADVMPHPDMLYWMTQAHEHDSVVIFEETPAWVRNCTLCNVFRPLVSNFPDFPAYASCVIGAPRPRAPFFLDLLRAVNPSQWQRTREPLKTLMTAGPGHLTKFANNRGDVIIVSQEDGRLAYAHEGLGTWKPQSTLLFEKHPFALFTVFFFVGGLLVIVVRGTRKKRSPVDNGGPLPLSLLSPGDDTNGRVLYYTILAKEC